MRLSKFRCFEKAFCVVSAFPFLVFGVSGCSQNTIHETSETVSESSEEVELSSSENTTTEAAVETTKAETTRTTTIASSTNVTTTAAEETTSTSIKVEETTSAVVTTTGITPVITTQNTTVATSETTAVSEYVPDSSHYISIVSRIGSSMGLEVRNETNWDFYQNPIMLDSSLSDSVFESYVTGTINDLVSRSNGNRFSICVWIRDERTSGFQTHGPGFYLYIG